MLAAVAHFAVASGSCNPGEAFLKTVADKEQLVGPVKQRGNANFKEQRYRAAIADYSRAIKLWLVNVKGCLRGVSFGTRLGSVRCCICPQSLQPHSLLQQSFVLSQKW